MRLNYKISVGNLHKIYRLELNGPVVYMKDLLNNASNPPGRRCGAQRRVEPQEISQPTPWRNRPQQNQIMLLFLRSLVKEISFTELSHRI